jgi:hypothetical protein
LLGTVFLHTDYNVPVDALRAELQRLVQGNPLWDGRAVGIQVTDAKERTMELRVLVSATDSGKLWDLRCELREKLIAFLHANYSASLPKLHVELSRTMQVPQRLDQDVEAG